MTYGKFGKPSNKPVCLSLFTRFINTRIYLMTADWSVSAEKKKKSQCAFIQAKGKPRWTLRTNFHGLSLHRLSLKTGKPFLTMPWQSTLKKDFIRTSDI